MKAYIITGTSGQYSDRTNWNVCVFMDKGRAEEFADKLNRITAFNNAARKRAFEEFEKPYRAEHELAFPDRPIMVPEFARVNGIVPVDRTDEEKATHRKLSVEHMQRIQSWNEECMRISKRNVQMSSSLKTARENWLKTNCPIPPELEEVVKHASDSWYSDAKYNWEEAEVLL